MGRLISPQMRAILRRCDLPRRGAWLRGPTSIPLCSTLHTIRCENMLAVTGAEDGVDAFKRDHKSVEASASFLPRGLAFFGPQPLSFQRLLPCDQDESYRQYLWGCASDAANVHLLPGRPRLAGRSSIQFLFSTDNAPLAWLKSAAEQHPTLRLSLKYAIAENAHEPGELRCLGLGEQGGQLHVLPRAQAAAAFPRRPSSQKAQAQTWRHRGEAGCRRHIRACSRAAERQHL